MNKKLSQLTENLKRIFVKELIDKTARKTRFVQRDSKLTAEKFISLCVFLNEELCTKLESNENVLITTEGLNQRFNENSVKFIKEIFKQLLKRQNNILKLI